MNDSYHTRMSRVKYMRQSRVSCVMYELMMTHKQNMQHDSCTSKKDLADIHKGVTHERVMSYTNESQSRVSPVCHDTFICDMNDAYVT